MNQEIARIQNDISSGTIVRVHGAQPPSCLGPSTHRSFYFQVWPGHSKPAPGRHRACSCGRSAVNMRHGPPIESQLLYGPCWPDAPPTQDVADRSLHAEWEYDLVQTGLTLSCHREQVRAQAEICITCHADALHRQLESVVGVKGKCWYIPVG